jgi:hypothetical protein
MAASKLGKPHPYHARRFEKAQRAAYEQFLQTIRYAVEQSKGPPRLHFTLNNLSWKTEFIEFVGRLVTGALGRAGVVGPAAVRQLQALFPDLVTLQRLLRDVESADEVRLEIDRDDITEHLGTWTTAVQGRIVAVEQFLAAMYRSHRTRLFPTSPALVHKAGIAVVSDTRSIIVQAADVVGNFAMAYAMYHLGDSSRTREVKAGVFEAVFGDVITADDVIASAELRDGELALKTDGALTLNIGNGRIPEPIGSVDS